MVYDVHSKMKQLTIQIEFVLTIVQYICVQSLAEPFNLSEATICTLEHSGKNNVIIEVVQSLCNLNYMEISGKVFVLNYLSNYLNYPFAMDVQIQFYGVNY